MPPQDKIERFLDSLENFELAFLFKYNLDSYLEDSSNKIKRYIKERGLTNAEIEFLINEYKNKEFNDSKARCSRCHSDKVQITFNENNSNYQLHCNVCGLNEHHPKKSKGRLFLELIRDFVLNIGH